MQMRDFPAENVYKNPDIDFFEMPIEIADQYYIHVVEPAILDDGGVLLDYFVEAVDTNGYIKRSPILHTFVGTGHGNGTAQSSDFMMDGLLDEGAQFIGSENDVDFYADWNHEQLYVACTRAGAEDHFIIIADGSSMLMPAPWAKSGQVARWNAFLGNESTNGWSGWFDGGSLQTCGTVLEGVLDWNAEFGGMPESVFVAFGAYETQDGGGLQFQIPSGDGNGNIEFTEFRELTLCGDLDFNGRIDITDFAVFAEHWMEENCSTVNNWCGGADMNHMNDVDIADIAVFAAYWLN